MKRISVFQTSDGKLHENELDAITQEFRIELRGIIQSNHPFAIKDERVAIGTLIDIVTSNSIVVRDLINKHNQKVRGYNERKAVVTA